MSDREYNYVQQYTVTGETARIMLEGAEIEKKKRKEQIERWREYAESHPNKGQLDDLIDRVEINMNGTEEDHKHADATLLDIINDETITEIFNAIPKWYA